MPEETPQLPASPSQGGPVSEQETQIEAPSFIDKLKLQKKKILIGLGVFFGVLGLVGAVLGAYLIGQRSVYPARPEQGRGEPVEGPTPTPEVATPTKSIYIIESDREGWETYRNEPYLYEFSYPIDLMKFPVEKYREYSLDPEIKFSMGHQVSASSEGWGLEISTWDNPQSLGLTEWVDFLKEKETWPHQSQIDYLDENYLIDGYEAVWISTKANQAFPESRVYCTYKNMAYEIRMLNYEEKKKGLESFNLILLTFKFLEEESCGEMSLEEAEGIALVSECVEEGSLTDTSFCNEDTGTWWIDLDIDRPGCAPACVINVSTKEAEINWRCTGLIPD